MPGPGKTPGARPVRFGLDRIPVVLLALAFAGNAAAAGPYAGRPLSDVLEELRAAGAPLIYSTNLVKPGLEVVSEPHSRHYIDIAREILTPHDLGLEFRGGVYLVVRIAPRAPPEDMVEGVAVAPPDAVDDAPPLELENVTVFASRYLLQAASAFYVDQRAIQVLPDLGEDPLRAAHRLPGAAASGLSSKTHFRGGEHDETAIYLDGLRLLDPFHIRDYHSIFSSIDARAITGLEAFTGGFPVRYGDHMSGVLSLETRVSEDRRHTELGLSVYNTSLLHSGFSDDGRWDWLVSVRDSNLDLVLDPDLGSPDYFDVFAQLGHRLSGRTYVSLNALYANDSVVVITESDPAELERSDSDTENLHLWLRLDHDWRSELSTTTVLSARSFDNLRVAEMNDPDQMVAHARDSRDSDDWGIRQDWLWTGWTGHDLRWGFEYRDHGANYEYAGIATYLGLQSTLPDLENPREYVVRAAPRGHGLSMFVSDRWGWTESTWLQYGLRWDRQTWTEPRFDDQLSPRLSLLHRLDANTDLRLSWGRYYQSQAINRLQVEDGLDEFFAPQRSDHFIAGYRRYFPSGYRLRAELFLKRYDRLKPRFENLFDPLSLIPELAPDRVRLDPQSAQARGVELSLEHRGTGPLEWWASYVLSRANDRIEGRNQPRSWDQRHALQAGLSWRSEPWEVGLAVAVHSGWPTTPLTAEYDPDADEFLAIPGERNSEKYNTFFTLDFRVSREFQVSKGRLSAFLEVSNATNRDNECCVDYDLDDEVEPPVVDRSPDFWVPIIPAIGVLWEF